MPSILAAPVYDRDKPARGAWLDGTNPLTKGLVFYVPLIDIPGHGAITGFTTQDMISRVSRPATTPAQVATGQFPDLGSCFHFTTTATAAFVWNVGTAPSQLPFVAPLVQTDVPFAIAIKLRSDLAITGGSFFTIGATSGSEACGIFQDASGTITWNVGTGTNLTSTTAFAGGVWYTVVINHYKGGVSDELRVFDRTGLLLESKSGTTTATTAFDTSSLFLGYCTNAQGNPTNGSIEWAGMWNRTLDVTEQAALASRPYQILARPAKRWKYAPTTAPPPATVVMRRTLFHLGARVGTRRAN